MNIKEKSSIRVFIFSLLTMLALNAFASESKVQGTRGYTDERYKPVEPYNGPTRTGQQVYGDYCATCHNRTTQGAPLPDDDVQWGMRIKKGNAVLLKHVMEGYKELMPVKGGCRNCSEQEVQAAINYILETSGIKKPGKKIN